jgi:hypothetical protein
MCMLQAKHDLSKFTRDIDTTIGMCPVRVRLEPTDLQVRAMSSLDYLHSIDMLTSHSARSFKHLPPGRHQLHCAASRKFPRTDLVESSRGHEKRKTVTVFILYVDFKSKKPRVTPASNQKTP